MIFVDFGTSKVIEGFLSCLNDVGLNKRRSLSCPLLRAFDAAFPFHNSPNITAVFGQLGKNSFKVDLSIAGRTITPCPVNPNER